MLDCDERNIQKHHASERLNLLRRRIAEQFSAAGDLAFRERGASLYSLEMQGKFRLRRKRFLQRFFVISLMAKLTLAITLAEPIDDKKCNSVSLSWIHENNDRVSRSWIVFVYGRRLDKTHVRKISS